REMGSRARARTAADRPIKKSSRSVFWRVCATSSRDWPRKNAKNTKQLGQSTRSGDEVQFPVCGRVELRDSARERAKAHEPNRPTRRRGQVEGLLQRAVFPFWCAMVCMA